MHAALVCRCFSRRVGRCFEKCGRGSPVKRRLFLDRKTKCRRHDADDLIWRVVQGDRLLQNISVGTETALPKFVTENNDPRAGFIVVSSKGAAEYRVHTQHAKEIGSNECAVEMRGFA